MEISILYDRISIYTIENQAQFIRNTIIKQKIKVLDMAVDFSLFEHNKTVKLTIKFSNNEDMINYTENHFYKILDKALMQSGNEFQIVKIDSFIYAFSRLLKWGKKYDNPKLNITFKILQKEKIEFEKQKRLKRKIEKLNN